MKTLLAFLLALMVSPAIAGDIVSKGGDNGVSLDTATLTNLCVNSGATGYGTCGVIKAGQSTGFNVGIGKQNPATILDVNGTVTATSFSGNSVVSNGPSTVIGSMTVTGATLDKGGLTVGTGSCSGGVTCLLGNGSATLDWGDTTAVGRLSFSGSNAQVRSIAGNVDVLPAAGNSFTVHTATLTVASDGSISAPSNPRLVLGANAAFSGLPTNVFFEIFWGAATSQKNVQYVATSSRTATVLIAGDYMVTCQLTMTTGGTGAIGADIFKNSSSTGHQVTRTSAAGAIAVVTNSQIITFAANDTVSCAAYDADAGGVMTNTGNNASVFNMYKLP